MKPKHRKQDSSMDEPQITEAQKIEEIKTQYLDAMGLPAGPLRGGIIEFAGVFTDCGWSLERFVSYEIPVKDYELIMEKPTEDGKLKAVFYVNSQDMGDSKYEEATLYEATFCFNSQADPPWSGRCDVKGSVTAEIPGILIFHCDEGLSGC